MIEPSIPTGEVKRQQALDHSGMLDLASSTQFDRLTHLARAYFGADFALVSLTDHDRQWFASNDGLAITEAPRQTSFCEHVLQTQAVLIVEDAAKDDRFSNNPFVQGTPPVRFYVGAPVRWQNEILGSFCVGGSEPRAVSEDDRAVLTNLAASVEREIELVRGAIECPLTGLLNRKGLMQVGDRMVAAAKREFAPLTCAFFDLNGLKAINDGQGHKAGDAAIVGFADCLQSVSRKADVVSHVSGDEYVLLMARSTAEGAKELCDRLDVAVANFNQQGHPFTLSYSVGIAETEGRSLEATIAEADAAMYVDKQQKKAG